MALLPIELWDDVAYCVGSTRDLLSLALTSRLFSSLIIPYHLPYRHIRCDIRRRYLWQHLADNPRCTRGIRSLGILDQHIELIQAQLPPPLKKLAKHFTPFDRSAMQVILKCLSHMTALETFTLSWRLGPDSWSEVVDISRVLTDTATGLRGLSINLTFTLRENRRNEIADYLNSLSMWQLSNLTQVILSHLCASAEWMLIKACPNLEDLCLYLIDIRACSCPLIFQFGNWTKLRRLTLLGKTYSSPPMPEQAQRVAADFFQRHASLECLLVNASFSPPSLSDSSLPMLRSLSWNAYPMEVILSSFLPQSALSRVVHCETQIKLFDCAAKMEKLETLQITLPYNSSSIPDFSLENAPNLRKLQFLGKFPKFLVASLVSSCTRVTHLYFAASSEFFDAEEISRKFSGIKTLQYIQVLFGKEILYMEIDRDPDGNYLGHHIMQHPKSQFSVPPSKWGNFFETL